MIGALLTLVIYILVFGLLYWLVRVSPGRIPFARSFGSQGHQGGLRESSW